MKSEVRTFSFGTCSYEKSSPPRENLNAETRILNINIDLDQALRLNLSLEECIRKIHAYKANAKAGRQAVVNLAIHLEQERISVNEAKLAKDVKKKAHQKP